MQKDRRKPMTQRHDYLVGRRCGGLRQRIEGLKKCAAIRPGLLLISITLPAAVPAQSMCGRQGFVHVRAGSSIAIEGDSLTYGQDETATGVATKINGGYSNRSTSPFPEVLAADLGSLAKVTNRGYPGDRLRDGVTRWRGAPFVNVVIAMYGGNDAINAGGLPGGTVPPDQFRRDLEAYVAGKRKAGSKVALLLTPPVQNPGTDKLFDQYRSVICSVGRQLSVPVIDTRPMLSQVKQIWVDGVHLTAAGYRAIGDGLARRIIVDGRRYRPIAPPAGSGSVHHSDS